MRPRKSPKKRKTPTMQGEEIVEEVNDYERLRQENILKNKALLKQLSLDAASISATRPKKTPSRPTPSAKIRAPKKNPTESLLPRRTSSRLAGLSADSAGAKRKADDDGAALLAAERANLAKQARVSGDLSFELKKGLLDVSKGARFEKTFTEEDVQGTSDKDLKSMREKMNGLKLYEKFSVNDIKITPERIYHLAFHPTITKQLIFASDKVGNLGIFDASASKEDSDGEPIPDISYYKIHSRTISTFTFDSVDSTSLYTSSYDGSVRKFDLATGVASEVYVGDVDDALSGVEVIDTNMLYFATLDGRLGRRDMRTSKTDIWGLGEKKIGGFGLHPRAPHLCATGSLDRTVKIWDLRKITGTGNERAPTLLGEHTSRLSVSCALWNSNGALATSSYDDTVKIYKFPNAITWSAGGKKSSEKLEPTHIVRHNNQTGRWVTILRPQWQKTPPGGNHKFVIGNMNRFLDIYSENGEQLAQLGDESITAVPAVAQFHPSMDWVAGGTASGKLALFN